MKLNLVVYVVFYVEFVTSWSQDLLDSFDQWAEEFEVNTNFSCEADRNRAIANFKRNKERIEAFNKTYKDNCSISYALGYWDYSHFSENDVIKHFNGLKRFDEIPEEVVEGRATKGSIFIAGFEVKNPVVTFFDWNSEGAVTSVRSQQACACCYAFAATGALEGQIFRKTKVLERLSTQQLVDCTFSYGNAGCQYGNPSNVYKYIKDNGIAEGSSYLFKGQELGICNYTIDQKAHSVRDYRYLVIKSNELLRNLLYAVGPLVVGVNSRLFSFQNYKTGIYDDPQCTGGVDHAMLLTGFGTDLRDGDYWIVKNSWGKNWGENGYIRMTREVDNFCGLWEMVMFPVYP
jgi:cathepsin L